jgi:5-methylcytosine-specific restriction endonuclease McrA
MQNKIKSKIKWSTIKTLVKNGIKPVDIERKYNGAVTASQIYRKKRQWAKDDYYNSDKYAKYRTPQYVAWRTACLKRDNYKCVVCGRGRPARLQVDHIIAWSVNVELRFEVDNGQTLCIPCHKRTPTYGYKARRYHSTYEKNAEWVRSEKERIKLERIKKRLCKLTNKQAKKS